MIRCEDLRGRVGRFNLGPMNLHLDEPVTAIIGPNGAGKSTFIETLLGWQRSHGRVYFNGNEINSESLDSFRHVSYVSDSFPGIFINMNADKYLLFIASVRQKQFGTSITDQMETAIDYLNRFGQTLRAEKIKSYSFGMRRKLQLVAGVMHHPDLLVIDEPQTGLDFRSSSTFRSIITELTEMQGRQVIMSNHDLDSVARSADRVLAINEGQVTADLKVNSFASAEDLEHDLENAFRLES